jgi:hypothetical protein
LEKLERRRINSKRYTKREMVRKQKEVGGMR